VNEWIERKGVGKGECRDSAGAVTINWLAFSQRSNFIKKLKDVRIADISGGVARIWLLISVKGRWIPHAVTSTRVGRWIPHAVTSTRVIACLHVKCLVFCPILTETYLQVSVKLPNIKFNGNPFNGFWVVTCVQTNTWMIWAVLIDAPHGCEQAYRGRVMASCPRVHISMPSNNFLTKQTNF
jgi:hypothetical protein